MREVFKSDITFVISFKLPVRLIIKDYLFLYLECFKTSLTAKLTNTGSLFFSHIYAGSPINVASICLKRALIKLIPVGGPRPPMHDGVGIVSVALK